jgi:hypothetical protein
MKAGYKTSEFWVTLAGMLLGVVGLMVSTFFAGTGWGSTVLTVISGLAMILPIPGYQISRGMAKKADPEHDKKLEEISSAVRKLSITTSPKTPAEE